MTETTNLLPFLGRRIIALSSQTNHLRLEFETGFIQFRATSPLRFQLEFRTGCVLFGIHETQHRVVINTSSGLQEISASSDIEMTTIQVVSNSPLNHIVQVFHKSWGSPSSEETRTVWMGRKAPPLTEGLSSLVTVLNDNSTSITEMDHASPILLISENIKDPVPFIHRWWESHHTSPILGLWLESVVALPEDLDLAIFAAS